MTRELAFVALAAFVLAGCASTPPSTIVVSGNGKCHPSQALPAHKVVKLIPTKDMQITPLFDTFADERKAHGDDVRDYNTLWNECVGEGAAPAAGTAK